MSAEQNIHQRIHAAQNKVDYIQKEKKAGMRYSIVSHDAVTAKVRPILHDCGVVYYPIGIHHTQHGNRTEVAMCVRFANIDNPEDHIDVPSLGYGIDDQDKGPGKAISYAVKYALLKTLGLETGDDPDIDQDVRHEPERPALGSGKARDEMDTVEAWAAWAKGGVGSKCEAWIQQAKMDIQAMASVEDVDRFVRMETLGAKQLRALHDHNEKWYDRMMQIITAKRDELAALQGRAA
jgi:hypothetical protein